MLSSDEVEEALPFPIKIEICCDSDEFNKIVPPDSFTTLLLRHNKDYETKIEKVIKHFVDSDEGYLDQNEWRVFVGKEVIYFMRGPESYDDPEFLEEYYRSIVNITEGILKTWHDKIIEIQNENEKKIEQFKIEGYDEMLYGYYCLRGDRRAFQYLKRLAARYPHSSFMNQLCRVYRRGQFGWHRRDQKLFQKMKRGRRGKDF